MPKPSKKVRYWVSITTTVVVRKNTNLAGTAVDAKGYCLQGYEPVLQKEEGAYPTGVVRFRQQPPGVVQAVWEPHPYYWNPSPPQWAVTVLNIIND